MILGMCKNLGVSPDYVLYEMTYENLIMYGYATPTYDEEDEKGIKFDESKDANNPDNFKHLKAGIVTNPFEK